MATALALPHAPGYAFDVSANLSDAKTRTRLTATAIKSFLRIVEHWGIKDPNARRLLGGISTGSYYAWKKHSASRTLDQDTLTRISLLIGIFKSLNILYSESLADAWITLPNRNAMFHGSTPLDYMIQRGLPGMVLLRQLLDARRGGQ